MVWGIAQQAHAQPQREPVLHEYLAPDTKEDLALSTTTASGELPAAIRTPSGTVTPPDVDREPDPRRVYSEASSDESTLRPDRDTRRPEVEHYDDPFSPSLTPFKRLHGYDGVRPDYSMYVLGTTSSGTSRLRPVVVGRAADDDEQPGQEHFFGDMTVSVRAGRDVRIPTVGPDSRLLKLVTVPDLPITVWRDGADNWFVRAERSARIRLVTELAIARDTFGSPFADVPWSALRPLPPQPPSHRRAFARVAAEIGISRAMRPREALGRMVAYFRSFEPSNEFPNDHGDIYLDLALSRKGVCRHRSFAFLVTALNIGLPTRFVANEAHAWVEVHDSRLWHRIDLGGAAATLADQPHLDRPPHVPPPDPYPWPTGRDSGEDLAHREREAALRQLISSQGGDGTGATSRSTPSPVGSGPPDEPERPGAHDGAGGAGETHEQLPESTVTVDTLDHDVFRGLPLHLKGRVRSKGRGCGNLRVDVVVLVGPARKERRVGSLSTDERGVYDGAVVLPRDLPTGDHELLVTTRGDRVCGPGQVW
ncbi:MAG: transglutaminase domain-containing protein [Deltaproteobacteria bacterium]|nr:transglutaminase domain-containing protein [Deltaproteobacteria bacterium]MBW2532941.1 transglutaminase domain-containing protein [Deltaproteobacteria bacterium]